MMKRERKDAGRRIDTLSFKEFKWLKCFNNRREFRPRDKRSDKGDRTCKQNVIIKIENLPKNIDFFLEEVLELTKASERRDLPKPEDREEMLNKRREILDKLSNSVVRLLDPLEDYSETLKVLERTFEEFKKLYKSILLEGKDLKEVHKPLSKRLDEINVHPGVEFQMPNIINELKLHPDQYSLKEGFIMNSKSIDKLERIHREKLESAVKNIMSKDEYWLNIKENFDIEFLRTRKSKLPIKIMERLLEIKKIKDGRIDKNSKKYRETKLSKIGKWTFLIELYMRGLISDRELSNREIVELYRNTAQKCTKKEDFSIDEGSCECVKKGTIVERPKNISSMDLQLTGYGEDMLNKIKSLLPSRPVP